MCHQVQSCPAWVIRELRRIAGILRSLGPIRFVLLAELITLASSTWPPCTAAPAARQSTDTQEARFYVNGHPYFEMPLEQLVEYIPELKSIRPAGGQQALPMVLEKTGARVDEFFRDIINLAAREHVTQEKLSRKQRVQTSQDLQYNYIIIVHRDEKPPRFEEYRTNAEGESVTQKGATKGYAVTTGFALKCIYFSTAHQSESTFLYLGDDRIAQRNSYVVAFAQRPGHTTIAESVSGSWGADSVFVQGIAWIDQNNFQIVRLRTDLLAPPVGIGLTRQTTDVSFAEIRLPDIDPPLWLPSVVNVYAVCDGQAFRNEHRYANYERYRVTVKMKAPRCACTRSVSR